jgi:uncharacterized protein (DUF2267 family)
MSTTGLEAFDTTLQKTHAWLKELMEELEWEDRHKAYLALRTVLHALRDHLTVEEVAQLGAQLPLLIRGIYYEGWNPSGKPVRERHRENFLAAIAYAFRSDLSPAPQTIARAVFTVLSHRITEGEIEDVKHLLPKELREMWP